MIDFDKITTVEDLFELWKEAHITEVDTSYLGNNIPKHMFLPDGIISSEKFNRAKQKILFIAKEANWFQENVELSPKETIESMFWHQKVAFDLVPKTQFSYRLSLLANAIITADENNFTIVDKSHEALKSVAVINLNKRGGYAYCIWDTLNQYVKQYQSFIRKQIDLINPDLIVCCGYDVKWMVDEYNLVPAYKKIIWVYHPSYFAISDSDYLSQLKCAITGEKWAPEHIQRIVCKEEHQTKGIIFDTNKTYSSVSTMDMLLSNKVSAYDDKAILIDNFNEGDYVFFSVKGIGVVAAGKVISNTEEVNYSDGLYERYKVVELVSPKAENIPHGEKNLKGLSWRKIENVLNKTFFKARTDKRPYLTEDECDVLIAELQKLNRIENQSI